MPFHMCDSSVLVHKFRVFVDAPIACPNPFLQHVFSGSVSMTFLATTGPRVLCREWWEVGAPHWNLLLPGVCREDGASVSTNVYVRDLDLANRTGSRRF